MLYNNIINADCIEFMKTLKNRSIDHIISNIPYARCSAYEQSIKQKIEDGKISAKNKYLKTAKFINSSADVCDFDVSDYIVEVERIAKKSIFIFADIQQISTMRSYLECKGWKGYRLIVWHKPNALPHNFKYNYISDIEYALYMFRDTSNFNKEQTKVKGCVYQQPIYTDKNKIHPTQKPPELVKKIIQDITTANATILDTCAGSGEIVVDAIILNRNAIGVEKNKKYYKKAQQRVEDLNLSALYRLCHPDNIPEVPIIKK